MRSGRASANSDRTRLLDRDWFRDPSSIHEPASEVVGLILVLVGDGPADRARISADQFNLGTSVRSAQQRRGRISPRLRQDASTVRGGVRYTYKLSGGARVLATLSIRSTMRRFSRYRHGELLRQVGWADCAYDCKPVFCCYVRLPPSVLRHLKLSGWAEPQVPAAAPSTSRRRCLGEPVGLHGLLARRSGHGQERPFHRHPGRRKVDAQW